MLGWGNKYLTDEEPWKKWKTDPEAVARILYTSVQLIAALGIVAKVFLPRAAEKILDTLNLTAFPTDWENLKSRELIGAGHPTKMPEVLFPRIEEEVIQAQKDRLEANKKVKEGQDQTQVEDQIQVAPAKDEITFDDFQAMDIRVGTILEATKVPKADKLLQFVVDTGLDKRTIVSGVAEHFSPEEMVGKQVTVLVNLKPRKIRGVESQGMILFAEDSAGKLHIVNPEYEVMKGSVVK